MAKDCLGRRQVSGKELAKFAEASARGVVSHRIDDLLEVLWVLGPESNAPFPII